MYDTRYYHEFLFLFPLIALSATPSRIGADWPTVERGSSVPPLEFTKEGTVLFADANCRLEIAREDETTERIQFSPVSPDGEYRVVIGDVYDFEPGYLVDVQKCGLQHLSIPRYFQPWFSWAPDGKNVLLFSDYEASPRLWVVNIETGQTFEVHKTAVKPRADTRCGLNEWAPKSGVGYLPPESVRWAGDRKFSFKLQLSCNPYSEEGGWPCDANGGEEPRAEYRVSIDLDARKVTTGPMVTLPGAKSRVR
jgi:hypothetical protein